MATRSPSIPKPRKKGQSSSSPAPMPRSKQTPKRRSSNDSAGYEARPYQLELLDAAIDENTIVNLGTGAGKTFIAVMLIKELCSSILLPFDDSEAKRTVFLVTTVPLVCQQANYIQMHTSFNVGRYTGDMGVDSWSVTKWRLEFENHQVLVMTMTIFKNLVQGSILPLQKVNLLIFDECHHAVKNHDYVQIMKLFKPHLEVGDEVPRVLGLSASLIPSKCKPADIMAKIEELEKILCCRSETARDLYEVARFATDPDEEVIKYEPGESDQDIAELNSILADCVDFLQHFKKKQKESGIYCLVKLYLEDLQHILENLGVWCADLFAKEGLRAINEELSECDGRFVEKWEEPLLRLGETRLKIFIKQCEQKLREHQYLEKYPTTSKVKKLAHFLGDAAVVKGDFNASSSSDASPIEASKLLGIVFVERRTTAAMLTKLLNHLRETQSDLAHIRCDYVVGHNMNKKGTYLRREATMNVKKQNSVLENFRKQKINLLISTSVVEEGVDVPHCNTVVRFDFPQNYRAYIQSKGRARAKVSKYLLLINTKEKQKQLADLANFRELERVLKSICQGRHVHDEEEILKRMCCEVQPYMPLGKDGPVATLGSSLSLVHKYCQKLPKDRYTMLTPIFKTRRIDLDSTEEELLFHSSITMPMSCPLHEPIEGAPMPTRRIAEKSAALEVVKRLHEAGELDDNFRVVSHEVDSDLEDDEKIVAKGVARVGTERRNDYYPNRVASSLSGCFPQSSHQSHLYIFLINEADDQATPYQYLGPPASTFGILSRKPLPYIKLPKFSLYEADKMLNVEVKEYHKPVELSELELEKLKLCHEVLFSELLKITHSKFQLNFEASNKNYLVVPLSVLLDEDPLEAFLNMEVADSIIKLKSPSGSVIEVPPPKKAWPLPLESFHDALVTDIHVPADRRKVYAILKIDKEVTLESAFPDPAVAKTYLSYFQTKYQYHFDDLSQPGLLCKPLGHGEKQLKMHTSRFKSKGENISKRQSTNQNMLFPELCSLYPVPKTVWKLAYCLPSILWRIECALSVEDFRSRVALETGIGHQSDNVEICTETYLHGYEDHGFGDLLTQKFTAMEGIISRQPVSTPKLSVLTKRGPDNALLLQAFTPRGANDSFDLERLETLGDSFLKLVTSIFLFQDRVGAHEGHLSSARSRRVGNLNLYLLAKKEYKKITEHILSTSFEPRQMWIPPCFSFVEEQPDSSQDDLSVDTQAGMRAKHYLQHKVTDKGVADCVESLIGAYLVSGGIDAGIKFMKWVGIKLELEGRETSLMELDLQSERCSSIESGEIVSSTSSSNGSLTPPNSKRHHLSYETSSFFNRPQVMPSTRKTVCTSDSSEPYASHSTMPTAKPNPSTKLPLFIKCSSTIFQKHFPPPCKDSFTMHQEVEVEKHLAKSLGTNTELKKFLSCIKNRALLLQALTHASYHKNRVTKSYQRLEFLGDAVLDYLVTCHIYSTFPSYSPGEISGMRTALVNNNTFAELAVKLNLHQAVLHLSPDLTHQISTFVSMLSEVKMEEGEQVVLVSDQLQDLENPSTSSAEMGTVFPLDGNEEEDSDRDIEELDPPKVLGDVLESVAGAIFLDSGCCLESVWNIFKPHFDQRIESFNGKVPVMPVQELLQCEKTVRTEKARIGRGLWRCTVIFVDKQGVTRKISAKGKTYKGAKMVAAKAALREMNKQ